MDQPPNWWEEEVKRVEIQPKIRECLRVSSFCCSQRSVTSKGDARRECDENVEIETVVVSAISTKR